MLQDMDNLLAVDIALLPDETLMQRCFDENTQLLAKQEGPHVFDPEHCIPHLTLTMGVIRRESLSVLQGRLTEFAQHDAPQLHARLVSRALVPANGNSVTEYVVDRTTELDALHGRAHDMMGDLIVDEATIDALLQPPVAEPITLEWIKYFRTKHSGEAYSPHITLGLGGLPQNDESIPFHGSSVALCHLGNYCTCRKILSSVALKS
jgi:hypothetical protein